MKVIGLTGLNAAGKGEVGNYLMKKGYTYYSLSDAIRDELRKENVELTRENLINKGNELRTNFGPGVLGKKTAEKINKERNYVIDSIRNPKEVEELRKVQDFKLLAIFADVQIRFQRAIDRGRVENATTLEEFKMMEAKENTDNPTSQQLNNTIALADYSISNNGTIEELHKKIEELLTKI